MGAGGSSRNQKEENKIIKLLDRARYQGPQGTQFDEGEKKRLHECKQGQWIKQILQGSGHFGPLLRVIDPKAGILENRSGVRHKLPPRTQVMVQP